MTVSKTTRPDNSTREERTKERKFAFRTNKCTVWYNDEKQLIAKIKDETTWLKSLAKKDDKMEAVRKQVDHVAKMVDELSRITK